MRGLKVRKPYKIKGADMFEITRDSSWEKIRDEKVTNLSAEGKIMLKIRRSFLSDFECSEFLRLAAEKVHQTGVPCYGKRGLKDSPNLPEYLEHHHTFMFYAKNRFDAIYVNKALTDALFFNPKIAREVTRDGKVGRSRAVTMNTKWKTDLETMNNGFYPEKPKPKKEVRKAMEFLVRNNPTITDIEIAALLAFNDYCPIHTCDLLSEGFVGMDDGLEVLSPILFARFSTSLDRDFPFFDMNNNINFIALLNQLSDMSFIVPAGMKQPSESDFSLRSYS